MHGTRMRQLVVTVLGLVSLAAGTQDAVAQGRTQILATATPGGTYYPVGVALETITEVKLRPQGGTVLSAINTAGSAENVRLLREGAAEFAIVQGLYGYYAWNGTGPVERPQEHLRAVTVLWQNVDHYTVRSDFAATGTVADLRSMRGRAMAMGRKKSGTIGSNRVVLRNLGIDIDTDYELIHGGYGESARALLDGRVAGMGTPGGVPVAAVNAVRGELGNEVTLLRFTDAQVEQADGGLGIWTPYLIPAGTYPRQSESIQTIAQPNVLVVHADVPEQAVYEVTRTIYEHISFLRGVHPATDAMSIDSALAGLPMPLHRGALRYYRERGLAVADRLRPEAR